MTARTVKALRQGKNKSQKGFAHREHRAKKNRTFVVNRDAVKEFKRKREGLYFESLE